MNTQALKILLERLPLMPVLAAFSAYLGYQYYSFTTDPSSPLLSKQQEIASTQKEIEALQTKIKQVNEFGQSLNLKKAQLRTLAQELEATKTTLSETLDVPELMKLLLIEAKRAGLSVIALKPQGSKAADFYVEQEFEFASSGIYFQYIAFLDRVANLQKIIRVENLRFVPISPSVAKYVQLRTVMRIKAYRYVGSKADELAKNTVEPPKPASARSGK